MRAEVLLLSYFVFFDCNDFSFFFSLIAMLQMDWVFLVSLSLKIKYCVYIVIDCITILKVIYRISNF